MEEKKKGYRPEQKECNNANEKIDLQKVENQGELKNKNHCKKSIRHTLQTAKQKIPQQPRVQK